MLLYCPSFDRGLCGEQDWIPYVTRYPASNGPFKFPKGAQMCLGNFEGPPHWSLRPEKAGTLEQSLAIHDAKEYRRESMSLCPRGVGYAPYAVPSTGHHGWIDKPEVEQVADAIHWAGIVEQTKHGNDKRPTLLTINGYDVEPNATPESGDPLTGYEAKYLAGRCKLGAMVSEMTGIPWAVIMWHREKSHRALWRHEIAPKLEIVKQWNPHAFMAWWSDHSFIAEWCAKLTDPVAIAAQAKQRAAVAPELFGGDPPDWSNAQFIHRRCREIRLAFANQVLEVLL